MIQKSVSTWGSAQANLSRLAARIGADGPAHRAPVDIRVRIMAKRERCQFCQAQLGGGHYEGCPSLGTGECSGL